jgi:hypothetical protein
VLLVLAVVKGVKNVLVMNVVIGLLLLTVMEFVILAKKEWTESTKKINVKIPKGVVL